MSWFDRRQVLSLIAAAPLAACGYVPAYGPDGPARGLMGSVQIDAPSDKDGFDLVGRLEERLGRPASPKWQLSWQLQVNRTGVGVTQTNTISRYQFVGHARYQLRAIGGGKVVASGNVQDFTSYSAQGTVVATSASESDARERLMRILADQIVTELAAGAADWAGK